MASGRERGRERELRLVNCTQTESSHHYMNILVIVASLSVLLNLQRQLTNTEECDHKVLCSCSGTERNCVIEREGDAHVVRQ